ncbi:MAG: replicative DNA helicase [Clostridia bacterium]|nr:replicative DNA helicase [Clostridia bacterium]
MDYNDKSIRKLPFSLEAEQAVLGSVLIDPECFPDVATALKTDFFYADVNREIFTAMQDLYLSDAKTIDHVTLTGRLTAKKLFDSEQECVSYLRVLANSVPSSSNVRDYTKIVRDKYLLRCLIDICGETSEQAFAEADTTDALIENALGRLYDLSDSSVSHGFISIKDAIIANYNHLKILREDPKAAKGTQTGFSGLDNVLVGMSPGDLVLVGARPGMGKTSFAMNIATRVAQQSKKTVCVFSLEMSAEQLASRMLSSEALVDSTSIRSGNLTNDDFVKIARAAAALSECDILIDDTSGVTISGMRSKLRKLRQEIGLIVVDYLQLMQSDRRIDNRVQEVADISRGLKLLAKDLHVPIICCAQLSRGPESRTDKRPMLSDLRDSGAIEQDADVVLFLYRDEYYDRNSENEVQNTAEVIIAKNRHGSTANIKMGWIGRYTKFLTLDER